jgi:hypothetical protein
MPAGPAVINVPPPITNVVFENNARTSLEDFVVLAEAAEDDTETGPMPEAIFTRDIFIRRGASLSRYATPPAGTIQQ